MDFLLDPGVTFLNHGSYGACPGPVFARWQQLQRELERNPVEFLARRFDALMEEARAVGEDIEALRLSLEALELQSNSLLLIRPESPADAAYARQLLSLIFDWLDRSGRLDVAAIVTQKETPIEAFDEMQMRRAGWLRVEKVQGLTRKAKRLRGSYRQFQDAVKIGGTVDHLGILRAIEELIHTVDALFPEPEAEVVR